MHQLGGRKCSFLFCLGVVACSIIYWLSRTKLVGTPTSSKPTLAGIEKRENYCQNGKQINRLALPKNVGSYIQSTNLQCSNLTKELHFINTTLSHEEENYPLAFIVTIHKELDIFVRMLRAIYMPQNVYCIHVDAKAPKEYQEAVQKLVSCFGNVFLSSRSEKVTYAGFSRLQADLNCMKDLIASPIAWRKVINLCGQDFPTMSNLELVQYMQSTGWRDKNMTPGVKQPATMKHRTRFQHHEIVGSHVAPRVPRHTKPPPPHNLKIYFGTAYYALTRDFVDFVLKNQIAHDFLEWSKDTFSPDEHYFVTLNHIKEAPGNHIDGGWEGAIRAIKWRDQEGKTHDGCKGHYVRDICVYGIEDIPWIIEKKSMFANKFEINTFPEALDCLEQWHRNKVLNQATVPINPSWLLWSHNNSINF
ncbi:beta-1,3-galactosyl-O-glycosyl-glycoprotein beta-1,6-N-acetylglucosaminyltransferase 7 [Poecilia formosa]|uniref:Glucosaminyl (N-acetyl) transferase family member 7 n=1 Tax=Poecilia formosa TaxID=48698 RepID=A0A096M151_POEFO|nr:PREDICTED: beta-1,3-galactosyl-O-glycosyl-glycoprotein beta-1,6-N-acetylglucosaminyltransferase 7-like [Poecilia formosa]XP_007569663.1 PREDICTED: beta-1,3-galactosyl-O-glycosyl-glycoprotein beta-1,6-N-acetylglucosaminyltransferase 7-like [Poecilia formosa]XP_007569664.1 PREDICTED: beta-1,3-galactosyl-O-glycosyl-glycoprotein beta-1,6-N-acetylglucosaminyltransferase 7-like [Poecilia formosa]XP_016535945.1 PREDICTED: beta-1,3-galactosyl-O-glycosyl-glycoprotein beta-1,6-N-acetylglucosaminyltrans